jgi:hypothetical protein
MTTLTEEEVIALKNLASVASNLEAILVAPNQRTDAADDDEEDAWIKRGIAGVNHLDNLNNRVENAWRGRK